MTTPTTPSAPDEVVLTAERIAEIKAATAGVTPGPWHPGHMGNPSTKCECNYFGDESHAGGIGQVFVDNGKLIADGGNDAPKYDAAVANMHHIANCDPQTVAALCDLALKALSPQPAGVTEEQVEAALAFWCAKLPKGQREQPIPDKLREHMRGTLDAARLAVSTKEE